ncbi:MAG: hypothetical protein OEX05_11215 [Chloroflexota bacterium]|nr:hypothetical protein [Chloroflexota bacterium]
MPSSRALLARVEALEGHDSTADHDELRRIVQAIRDCRPSEDSPEARERARAALEILPPRWEEMFGGYDFHAAQAAARNSTARFRAIEAGRRSGKTADRKAEIIERALDPDWFLETGLSRRHIVVGLPTQDQTRDRYLDDLIAMMPRRFVRSLRLSTPQMIETTIGARVVLAGMDKPERAEGDAIDDLFLDEFADLRKGLKVIDTHLRPALSTRGRPPGSVTAFGTPDMQVGDDFVRLCDRYLAKQLEGNDAFAFFNWSSRGIITEEEWAEARDELTAREFAVEYEARRVSRGDLAYDEFARADHVVDGLRIVPDRPLIACFDWNIRPGCSVIVQEQSVEDYTEATALPERIADEFTAIVGEVVIPQGHASKLVEAVAKWILASGHKGRVLAYGDPSGGSGHVAAEQTCVELLKIGFDERLGQHRWTNCIRYPLPSHVSRMASVNRRLRNADGHIRLVVDRRCPELIADFEMVQVKRTSTGSIQIDKPSDGPMAARSHASDAFGYYTDKAFPVRKRGRLTEVDA